MRLFKENHNKKVYNNPSTSLIHVMNLFEEKTKFSPLPLGPLPIKANGAIVVHRPSLHQQKSHSDMVYFTDEDSGEDEESPFAHDSLLTDEDEEDNLIRILSRENTLLKHKLYSNKVEKEKLAQELLYAQQKMKQLERINQRFEKIILSPKQPLQMTTRRQSTNSISQLQLQISSENKIQILLDEIDAMEKQEFYYVNQYKLQCEKLQKDSHRQI